MEKALKSEKDISNNRSIRVVELEKEWQNTKEMFSEVKTVLEARIVRMEKDKDAMEVKLEISRKENKKKNKNQNLILLTRN